MRVLIMLVPLLFLVGYLLSLSMKLGHARNMRETDLSIEQQVTTQQALDLELDAANNLVSESRHGHTYEYLQQKR